VSKIISVSVADFLENTVPICGSIASCSQESTHSESEQTFECCRNWDPPQRHAITTVPSPRESRNRTRTYVKRRISYLKPSHLTQADAADCQFGNRGRFRAWCELSPAPRPRRAETGPAKPVYELKRIHGLGNYRQTKLLSDRKACLQPHKLPQGGGDVCRWTYVGRTWKINSEMWAGPVEDSAPIAAGLRAAQVVTELLQQISG
jgi:hypothetical protein